MAQRRRVFFGQSAELGLRIDRCSLGSVKDVKP
jgi:hypothetical protein